jgi:hypothetical protein
MTHSFSGVLSWPDSTNESLATNRDHCRLFHPTEKARRHRALRKGHPRTFSRLLFMPASKEFARHIRLAYEYITDTEPENPAAPSPSLSIEASNICIAYVALVVIEITEGSNWSSQSSSFNNQARFCPECYLSGFSLIMIEFYFKSCRIYSNIK